MMLRAMPLLCLVAAIPARTDERRYMLTGFDRIRVDGPFEVTVVTGASAGAVASGDRRAIEGVEIRVQGTTLVVSAGVNAWGGYPGAAKSAARVTVTAATLRSAAMMGGGRLTIDRMRGQHVEVALTGSGAVAVGDVRSDRLNATLIGTGRITLGGRTLQGRFESSGAGAVEAAALSVGALTVVWQSAGDGRFAARDTADVHAAGQGAVTVDGTPSCAVRGNGPVTCGRR